MPAVSDSMLAQLDLYQLFLDSPKPSPSLAHLLRSSTTPTVLVVRDVGSVWEVSVSPATHLAYWDQLPHCAVQWYGLLRLFTPAYQPATLHLPVRLQPDRLHALDLSPNDHTLLLSAIDEALTTCRIRDIEVFWHELEPGRVHAVSPSLWRWAKERKAKLALEGAK